MDDSTTIFGMHPNANISYLKQEEKQVPKWKYVEALKLAGYWTGDFTMIHSFFDAQHDIKGWVK